MIIIDTCLGRKQSKANCNSFSTSAASGNPIQLSMTDSIICQDSLTTSVSCTDGTLLMSNMPKQKVTSKYKKLISDTDMKEMELSSPFAKTSQIRCKSGGYFSSWKSWQGSNDSDAEIESTEMTSLVADEESSGLKCAYSASRGARKVPKYFVYNKQHNCNCDLVNKQI